MELKLEQKLLNLNGGAIIEAEKPVTIKDAVISSLLGASKNDDTLTPVQKLEKYQLVLKIKEAKKTINLSVDELAMVKESIDNRVPAFSLIVYGQLINILNGEDTGIKKATKK